MLVLVSLKRDVPISWSIRDAAFDTRVFVPLLYGYDTHVPFVYISIVGRSR